jgi:hypothetical protein
MRVMDKENIMIMKSSLQDSKHINAMLKALRKAKVFKIDRDHSAGTVIVTHPKAGEVFRYLLTDNDVWLTRHAANLFV